MRSLTTTRAVGTGPKGVPLLLVMVLVLAGTGPCLCDAQLVQRAPEPHACCEQTAASEASSNTALHACREACPGMHTAVAVPAAAIGGQHSAMPVAEMAIRAFTVRPEPAAQVTLAEAHHSPPPRKRVLRI